MMTRSKAQAFANALVKLRDSATDEQAIEVAVLYPAWKVNTEYAVGARLVYSDVLYKVLQTHVSQADWTPDVAVGLFAKVLVADDGTPLAWVQPDSTNPYMTGDKVVHNEKTWVSTVDNNVWEPGVYGWDEI